jgi:hypothetical protein
MSDDKKALYEWVRALQYRLNLLLDAAEDYDQQGMTSASELSPQLTNRIRFLTDDIDRFTHFFSQRKSIPNYTTAAEAINSLSKDSEMVLASMVPLPNGQGIQLNLGVSREVWEEAPEPETISVAVYLDTNDEALSTTVLESVDRVVQLLGYGDPEEVETWRGSIFRKSFAKIRGAASSKEMRARIDKVERALELQGLVLPQSQADLATAQAVETLIRSLEQITSGCLRVGSIFLVKYQSANGAVVLTRHLSLAEIHALERYPEIQKEPSKVLDLLSLTVASLEGGTPPALDDLHQ